MTQNSMDTLVITWLPPDIPNGNIILYTVRAEAVKTNASSMLSLIESEIQGSTSNTTILRGLHPDTKYNITITASNEQGSSDVAYVEGWTLIGLPEKPTTPKILERRNGSVIVALTEGHSENGPITEYQVVVVQAGTIPPTDPDVEYVDYKLALKRGLNYYATAQFDPLDFPKYKVFTVGDGTIIGSYYNAPLQDYFTSAQIGLVVISRRRSDIQRSYSDLTSNAYARTTTGETRTNTTILVLCVAITFFSVLLAASILLYFILRRRHERFNMRKLPEQQELTLQGPVHEVDNMAYIPEDMPERVNHYQELKKKVWTIPRNALSIDNFTVRRGRFGTVHTGTVTKDDESCLVTIHIIADGSLKGSDKRHMLRELDVCIRAGSMKYLAGLVGTCETPDTLFVVVEMPLQILKSRLLGARSGDTFPMDRILSISSSVAAALRHLANHKIIHAQLCARSVGLTADWTPKLMGHGIAKYALEDVKYTRWTAIECFDNQKKNQSGVIWAFGVLLWEIFSMGGTPYSNLTLDSEVEDAVMQDVRLPQLMDMPDPIYEVMSSCWRNDPEERPTFDELTRLVREKFALYGILSNFISFAIYLVQLYYKKKKKRY